MATNFCAVQHTTQNSGFPRKLTLVGSSGTRTNIREARTFNVSDLDVSRITNPEVLLMMQQPPADESGFISV